MQGCADFYKENITIEGEDKNTEGQFLQDLYLNKTMSEDIDKDRKISRLEKRLAREKKARKEAETLLEGKAGKSMR